MTTAYLGLTFLCKDTRQQTMLLTKFLVYLDFTLIMHTKSTNLRNIFKIFIDSVRDYGRPWTKRKGVDLDTVSKMVNTKYKQF